MLKLLKDSEKQKLFWCNFVKTYLTLINIINFFTQLLLCLIIKNTKIMSPPFSDFEVKVIIVS